LWDRLDIVTNTTDGSKTFRRATLDTGADLNLIAEKALKDLKFVRLGSWCNGPVTTLNPDMTITPIEEVEIAWRVRGKVPEYNTKFAVIEEAQARDFDILLGKIFIQENRFLVRDPTVWHLALELTPIPSYGVE